jgi:hypothetical protein
VKANLIINSSPMKLFYTKSFYDEIWNLKIHLK